jgi:hypothetical protein
MNLKELLNLMSSRTKNIGILAGIVLLYAFLCRSFGIYFFWESKPIGWSIFLLFLISYFVDGVRERRQKGKSAKVFKILIGLCILFLAVDVTVEIILLNSSLFAAGKNDLLADKDLQSQTGKILSVNPMPYDTNLQLYSSKRGESGLAEFWVLVKGEKKFMEIELTMVKENSSLWRMETYK